MAWPEAAGGTGASVEEQMVIGEELSYQRLPLMAKSAADMLGTAIIRHGTPEQQARYLPSLPPATSRSISAIPSPKSAPTWRACVPGPSVTAMTGS
jgi:Acyl-CoA dehydrogenase, N-terminal domain